MTARPDFADAAPRAAVRPRRAEDWPAMLDLWVASWSATYPDIDFNARRDWLTRHVGALEAGGARTLCLFDAGGALMGFVVIDPVSGWLDQICVGPAHFGAGLGEMLLEAARAASPGVIRLDVNADNSRAIRFYERAGFAKVGDGANTLSGRKTIVMEWRG
ncbi:MAG: GNAT family N-acetyltransferase [Methylocystis sp.]|nr:GNAT family N-acetyltransferase [Methylocystis sp.]